MKWEYALPEEFEHHGPGVFIVNEGNFQYGNASLSFYSSEREEVENEVFLRANSMKLGDQAQSMTIADGRGWIAVCNSHLVVAIDPSTFRETGRITIPGAPRYVHIVSPQKGYISLIWDNRILVFNPSTYQLTGEILVPGMESVSGSTEQMVSIGDYLYCNCWSYQSRLLKIDTRTDEVVAEVNVGVQPNSLVADAQGNLWALTDGGYPGSPTGTGAPSIVCIDADNMRIISRLEFDGGYAPSELTIDGSGSRLYWLAGDVMTMRANPRNPRPEIFIKQIQNLYYGVAVDPLLGEVYVADAIDYQQPGIVYRYTSEAELIDSFYVGVTPGAFCFRSGE